MVYPIHTVRSDGSKVWDVDGNEYIDFVMGFGASLFGHRPPFVVEAIQRQLELGFEIGPIQPQVGEDRRVDSRADRNGARGVLQHGFGSRARRDSLRADSHRPRQDRDVCRCLSRHLRRGARATHDGQRRSARCSDCARHSRFCHRPGHGARLRQPGISRTDPPAWARDWRRSWSSLCKAGDLDLQPREFLHELRRITEETGTALVFDEVVTGFRVHPGGAQAYFDIRADMATYGKVVGGGMPIGIVAGKARFLDALDGGRGSLVTRPSLKSALRFSREHS